MATPFDDLPNAAKPTASPPVESDPFQDLPAAAADSGGGGPFAGLPEKKRPKGAVAENIEGLYNIGEGVSSFITSLVLGMPAYLAGGIYGLGKGSEDPRQEAQSAARAVTIEPKSPESAKIAETLSTPFTYLTEKSEQAGKGAADILTRAGAPGPLAAGGGALVESGMQMLPAAIAPAMRAMRGKPAPAPRAAVEPPPAEPPVTPAPTPRPPAAAPAPALGAFADLPLAELKPGTERAPLAEARPLEPEKITSAVVRFGGKEYEGPTHIEAIKKAAADGKVDLKAPKLDQAAGDSINLFRTNRGELIDRDEAGKRFGGRTTEEMEPLPGAKPKRVKPAAPIEEMPPSPQREPPVGKRLTSRIVELGGLNKDEARDTFGEGGRQAFRTRPGLFQTSMATGAATRRGNSLSSLVHDGSLDDYLPFDLRSHTGREDEAVDWLRERIAHDLEHKDVGPYETMLERDAARMAWQEARGAELEPMVDPVQLADEVGVEPTRANMIDAAKIDRARELDPEAVDRIPDQVDDATYMQHVEEIINAKRPDQEAPPPVAAVGEPPSPGYEAPAAPTAGGGPGGTPPEPPRATPPGGVGGPYPIEPPEAFGERVFTEQKPMDVAREQPKAGGLADALRQVFAPATRGKSAAATGGIVRHRAGELAHDTQVAQHKLGQFARLVDKLSDKERFAFIDAIEGGQKQGDARLQPAADMLRELLDGRAAAVQKLGVGALQTFIEDYFPHIWKKPGEAAVALEEIASRQHAKRPLKGSGAFLKERTIPTIADGMEGAQYDRKGRLVPGSARLEPVSSNPVELALLKLREMDKFIMGTRVMEEMKARGLARFQKFGEAPPDGWVKINDKAARVLQWDEQAKGFIVRGHYYAPEQAATIINNYLSPGLAGNAIYDTVRGTGNLLNLAQLGFSAFHLGFTTWDVMMSRGALAAYQLAHGDPKGIVNLARAAAPAAAGMVGGPAGFVGSLVAEAVANVWKGEKVYRAYMNPGTGGPLLESIVDGLVHAGGRVKMEEIYNATRRGSYWDSIMHRRVLEDFTRKGIPRGALELVPRLIQTLSAPIMEYIVPRQKLGVFHDLMKHEMEARPNMGPEEMRDVSGKIWDSVDNRLGELVYDNLFWNKVFKDLTFITVRSVGWNLGTVRELGGGALEYGKAALDVAQGKKPDFTYKMSYVASLAIFSALYGAVIQYLYTGEKPRELKDYFFPRTGRETKEGFPERVSPPSYMKDIFEYQHTPGQTIVNKANPLISTMFQLYENKDFYGAQIRDLDADPWKQGEQTASYLARQLQPFSYRGFQRQREQGAPFEQAAPAFFGLVPAPAYITRPPEVQKEMERRREAQAIRKRQREEQKDAAGGQ